MTFTIEPMIALGKYRDVTWPDNWTSTTMTASGLLSLVSYSCHYISGASLTR